jgi:FXSXX-COOH protein
VFRAIGGRLPLWVTPNVVDGRFNGATPLAGAAPPGARPVQYLCLHPLGPLAEAIRHDETGLPEAIRRNLFVGYVRLRRVLHVDIPAASDMGIEPEALVGDDYAVTRNWLDGILQSLPRLEGLRVPSAALPGTENLVLFGARRPSPYPGPGRRAVDLPMAAIGLDASAIERLTARVTRFGASPHPAVAAFRAGRPYGFTQPSAA